MNAEVVFTISPQGLKALHKEIKPHKGDLYGWLETADRHTEHRGHQIWEWREIEWGADIHNVLRHSLAAIAPEEFRLIIRSGLEMAVDGTLTGPFDVMAGTIAQGFPSNWIHVDVGYTSCWDEFGGGGDGLAPLGKQ